MSVDITKNGDDTSAVMKFTQKDVVETTLEPKTATCNGNAVDYTSMITDANTHNGELMKICRAKSTKGSVTFSMSCRDGYGGARRRRYIAWDNCPKTAPSTSTAAASEPDCIEQPLTFTKAATPCSPQIPSVSAAGRMACGSFGVIISLLALMWRLD